MNSLLLHLDQVRIVLSCPCLMKVLGFSPLSEEQRNNRILVKVFCFAEVAGLVDTISPGQWQNTTTGSALYHNLFLLLLLLLHVHLLLLTMLTIYKDKCLGWRKLIWLFWRHNIYRYVYSCCCSFERLSGSYGSKNTPFGSLDAKKIAETVLLYVFMYLHNEKVII